jgi:hypothetical protein
MRPWVQIPPLGPKKEILKPQWFRDFLFVFNGLWVVDNIPNREIEFAFGILNSFSERKLHTDLHTKKAAPYKERPFSYFATYS